VQFLGKNGRSFWCKSAGAVLAESPVQFLPLSGLDSDYFGAILVHLELTDPWPVVLPFLAVL
jgi:hypothetical protein